MGRNSSDSAGTSGHNYPDRRGPVENPLDQNEITAAVEHYDGAGPAQEEIEDGDTQRANFDPRAQDRNARLWG